MIFTEGFGVKILEAYEISYANPKSGDERDLIGSTLNVGSEHAGRAGIGHTHDFYHYIYAAEADGAYLLFD